jgi:hypothetical protein
MLSKYLYAMSNLGSQQQQSNSGSPMGTPTRTPTKSRENSPIRGLSFGSPESGVSLRVLSFDSPDSPKKRDSPDQKKFQSPPKMRKIAFGRKIDLGSHIKENEEENFPFSPTTYIVNLDNVPASSEKIGKPFPEFFSFLVKKGSISPTTDLPSRGNENKHEKKGSFFTASFIGDGYVIKKATAGNYGTLDKKDLVRSMKATAMCSGFQNCANVASFHINHRDDEKNADLTIVQEECEPLQKGHIRMYLLCIIDLLKSFIPKGLYPTDLKIKNFGMGKNGIVKWFDFDLKEVNLKKGFSFIKSGEFQQNGNPMFQQFILMLMEFYCPIGLDRNQAFGELNNLKGLLKSLNLLSSEKSISETMIEDFSEVLRNIGLSEEDNAYLVGLLTPPPSSQ